MLQKLLFSSQFAANTQFFKLTSVIIEKLKEAETIGIDNPMDNRWAKISYDTQEIADKIVNEPEIDNTDYTIFAKILIANYSMLISESDIIKMKKLIQIVEQSEDGLQKTQAQQKLKEVADEYPVLFHVFFVKVAAAKAADINPADAQRLHKMHDTIVFHFQHRSPDEAFEALEKATELISKYINPADGLGGINISKI